MQRQQTVRSVVKVQGVGLHSGDPVTLRIRPAKQDTGILFRRVDLKPAVEIPLGWAIWLISARDLLVMVGTSINSPGA